MSGPRVTHVVTAITEVYTQVHKSPLIALLLYLSDGLPSTIDINHVPK